MRFFNGGDAPILSVGRGMALLDPGSAAAPPSAPDPLLTDLAIWYDSSHAFQDTARTTLAVANADPIAGLEDRSGSGRHASQGTLGAQSSLTVPGLNGRPLMTPDATDDHLLLPSDFTPAGGFTVYAVGTLVDAASNWCPLGGGASHEGCPGIRYADGNIYFGSDAGAYLSATGAVSGAMAWGIRLNGAGSFTRRLTGLSPSSTGNLWVLGSITLRSVLARVFAGQWNGAGNAFGEILFYDRVHTDGEMDDMSDYFTAGWGVGF